MSRSRLLLTGAVLAAGGSLLVAVPASAHDHSLRLTTVAAHNTDLDLATVLTITGTASPLQPGPPTADEDPLYLLRPEPAGR